MDFGEVLTRAWQIIWKYKVLWIFGILAGCSNPYGSETINYSFRGYDIPPGIDNFGWQLERMPDWQIFALIGVAILVVLVLALVAIFLTTIGRIGMIRGTQQAEQGAAGFSFGELFSGSLPYFWRVFLLNLLAGLVSFAAIMFLVILFAFGAFLTFGLALICLIPLICLLVPLFWLLYVYLEQANIAIVVDNLSIMDGLRRGWQVFTDNLGTMIIMGLILYVGVALIGGMIIGAPLFLIAVPALGGLFLGRDSALWGGLLIAGLCFVAYLPVLILLNGILTSYIESAWTLTYMRLTGRPTASESAVEVVSS